MHTLIRIIILTLLPLTCTVGQLAATETVAVWKQIAALPAPEAIQAAAADAKFAYAINNKHVVKYDRMSGQRVAASTGDAKHLNSGFLFEGRLFCAHSNYPRTPERSEIKVLDLETMELSTFKEFGEYGGSLTWAVQHEGSWWCNFARYGSANSETFLVQFDSAWDEKGRWTYPAEVIRELGRYSLSGGIWKGDALLVTGHDHRVMYELRLPTADSVLEYVGKHTVPFTGQGIAHDPSTGGLVGIDRSKKQIVFAAIQLQPQRLRVLTYNIHHGEGMDRKLDLERIAKVIESAQPDIVALQEVDKTVKRSQSVDQPAELARLTNMQAVFGSNISLQGGEYGNAVLSKYPIRGHKNHKLPNFDAGEQRGVLEVQIEVHGLREPLQLLATHLDHRADGRERLASAKAINELVTDDTNKVAVLAGDLNAVPDSNVLKEFTRSWSRTNVDILPTIPVDKPSRQIDYVLVRPRSRWKLIETKVLDEAVASDHRPLLAVVELVPQRVD